MKCCSVFVMFTALLASVCALGSNVFPLFVRDDGDAKRIQTLWYSKNVTNGASVAAIVTDSPCEQYFLYSLIAGGGVLAGGIIGAMIFAATMAQLCYVKYNCCFFVYIWILIVLAFCGSACGVAVSVFGYLKGYCQDDDALASQYAPFKGEEYKVSMGFFLVCGATFLFFGTIIMHIFAREPEQPQEPQELQGRRETVEKL